MGEFEGKLQMKDFCFPNITFKRKVQLRANMNLKIDIKASYDKLNNKEQIVTIKTTIADEQKNIELEVDAQATFELINADVLNEESQETLLNVNTIAIMMPYVRSQVALITTQPGLTGIQIPIVDANIIAKHAQII
ncbi:MAG: protein-export chaperone SecB [Clostridia bacterium]|nr:protein-export chaperone SecB [Clostridia bacterium]